MVSLVQLTAAVGPALVPIDDAARGPVEVTGVHISELPDPTPYLEGGEMLLTTGMPLTRASGRAREYVGRLVDRGVRALVLGLGPIHHEMPQALREACAERGMPLLVVTERHAFRTVTTGYWDLVAAQGRAGLVEQIGTQTSVVREAARVDGGAAVARLVAQSLGSWAVAFPFDGSEAAIWPESAAGVLPALGVELHRFAQRGDVGSATFPLHGYDVIAYPVGQSGRAVGAFVVGTTRRLSRTDRQLILTATAALSLRASLRSDVHAAGQAIAAALAELLVADDVTAAQALARAAGGWPLPASMRVFAARQPAASADAGDAGAPALGAEAILAELVRRGLVGQTPDPHHPPLATTVDGCLVVVIDAADDVAGDAHTSAESEPYSELTGSFSEVAPLGSVRAAAMLAVRTARRAATGVIVPAGESGGATRGEEAAALLEGYTRAPLIGAVRGYLRHRGSWEHAARDLGVHRNTVRARVRTARETLGLDLDDPDLAAELWIALRDREVQ